MRRFHLVTLAALAAIASGCSRTEGETPKPVVRTVYVKPELSPESRKVCPPLQDKTDRQMSEAEVFGKWAADRTARNVCETRRAAAVAAVDAVVTP